MVKKLQKKIAEESGNTTQTLEPRIFRARSYQLTLNKIETYEEIKKYITEKKSFNYLISCNEIAPTTGKKHIHIYVHFNKTTQLNINKLLGAHIEKCRGSPQQNIKYIEKDGDIIEEIGKRPNQGGMTVKDLEETADVGTLPWQMYNTWNKIHTKKKNNLNISDFRKNVKVYYIQGESGIGKTEKALDLINENKKEFGEDFNSLKYENGFWDGIGDAKIALYDDFRDSHMRPSEFINFIDYNIHSMNIKGSSEKNKYELIIITSVQKLENIYKNVDNEPRKQWERRIEIIDMEENKNFLKDRLKEWEDFQNSWIDGPLDYSYLRNSQTLSESEDSD